MCRLEVVHLFAIDDNAMDVLESERWLCRQQPGHNRCHFHHCFPGSEAIIFKRNAIKCSYYIMRLKTVLESAD